MDTVFTVAEFTNAADGMTAFVVSNGSGGYNVTVRDDDSGEYLPMAFCGYVALAAATAKARAVVGVVA